MLAPGAYATVTPGTPREKVAPNHSPRFYVDEAGMLTGLRALTHATVGVLHASASFVTTVTSGAGNVPLHPLSTMSGGLLAVGGVVSTVRINFCVTVIPFKQASFTLYVRRTVSMHPFNVAALSLTHATTGVLQASASSVTTATFGAGNVPLHPLSTMSNGLLAVGGVVSRTVIV